MVEVDGVDLDAVMAGIDARKAVAAEIAAMFEATPATTESPEWMDGVGGHVFCVRHAHREPDQAAIERAMNTAAWVLVDRGERLGRIAHGLRPARLGWEAAWALEVAAA